MRVKKRNKRSRLRGSRRCGYGFGKKHRGKGSKGGKGMAGTGKRAGQKRTWVDAYMPGYFGKRGFKSLNQKKRLRLQIINLNDIEEKLSKFLKSGVARKTPDGIELNLKGYRILGKIEGDLKNKMIIKADSASKSAKDKIEKAGGKILEN